MRRCYQIRVKLTADGLGKARALLLVVLTKGDGIVDVVDGRDLGPGFAI